jgi:hypothetical protein
MDLQKYGEFFYNKEYLKLAQLPKLTEKQVAMHFGINEYFRALLHLCFGHYNLLLKCEKYKYLFYCYDILGAAIRFNKLKQIKFLESLGCFIHFCDNRGENAFTMALYSGNTKLIKYIKSRGLNIYKKLSYYPLIIYENPNKKQLISVLYIRDKTKYIMNYIT